MSSCHSSTTTSAARPSVAGASARESSRLRLSGVVTSTLGRRRVWAARSLLLVSPLRAPAVQWGARAGMGSCKARQVSAASARMGVSQMTVRPSVVEALVLFCALAKARKAPSHTA